MVTNTPFSRGKKGHVAKSQEFTCVKSFFSVKNGSIPIHGALSITLQSAVNALANRKVVNGVGDTSGLRDKDLCFFGEEQSLADVVRGSYRESLPFWCFIFKSKSSARHFF